MNKFVLGALALAASSTPCLAGSDDWLTFDREIESLSTSLRPAATGASVNGFFRANYSSSSDVQVGGNDLGGFGIDNARLNFSGTVGNYMVFVSLEGANGAGGVGATGVLDAYAGFNITGDIKAQLGVFRSPFLASSQHDEDVMLFIDRSALASAFDGRDAGAMVSGHFEQLGWAVAVMNGNDGAGNDLSYAGRVSFQVMGKPNSVEGAYGALNDTSLCVGVGYTEDQNINDSVATCFDAQFTMGAISACAQMVDLDKGIGDATPWDVDVSYMIVPDQWEAAVRYEDFDDVDNSTSMTLGVNWYQTAHAAKWQFNWVNISSDNNAIDGNSLLELGMTASI